MGAGSGENTLINEKTMMDTPIITGMTHAILLSTYLSTPGASQASAGY
jgi:hypothetical protein